MKNIFFRKIGHGHPLVVLHGLFGMSDNWLTIAKDLSSYFTFFLLDQRNHGRSFHAPEFNYQAMVDDLRDFKKEHNLTDIFLLGHSMGGKTAMNFALQRPDQVRKLVIVDIAPKSYKASFFNDLLDVLVKIDLSRIETRSDVDKFLEENTDLPQSTRLFLLKNLYRDSNNTFKWRINLDAVKNNLEGIMSDVPQKGIFEKKTLFISGESSNYIKDEDHKVIKQFFPRVQFKIIKNANHWVHATNPEDFKNSLLSFLNN